ncbi:ATP-dependent DNA ligase [Candidatus Woesearchaeota archaeon]|nr:ATP-dependent DNA ligase [Candidatus Woesearchaeota archaeon]
MRYKELSEVYERLASTSKRLEKIKILSDFLIKIKDGEEDIIYLLTGEIFPDYEEKKMGINSQLVIKSLSKSLGVDKEKIVEEWKKIGDLGEVAEKLIQKKKQITLQFSVLTSEKVLKNLRKLPELEGEGTINKKLSLIIELFNSISGLEAKYLTRTLIGDLRIGIQESTIREALSLAFFNGNKEASEKIQNSINKLNDLKEIFLICKQKDLKRLDEVKLIPGKPIKVMLAQKVKTIEEGFKEVGIPCAIEYKYDGIRIVIHKKNNKVFLFTRRLENVTKQFPEVVEYILNYVKGENFILDSEVVGFDEKTKTYKPFQNISQRVKRKYEIEKLRKELPVEVNIFDILFYNDKDLINMKFEERTKLIRKIVQEIPFKIRCSKQIITSNINEAKKFYEEALKNNQEGIMLKNLKAIYNPGSRVGHMLKMKPEQRDFDLVITGGEYGTGKRSGWISSFIVSCSDEGEYLEVGKVGTGIKEKSEEGFSFEELTEKIKPLIIKEEGKKVFIKPEIVVSITYQEIQKSPTYSSGFALRFPRFVSIREDKPLSEITGLEEIEEEFKNQKN